MKVPRPAAPGERRCPIRRKEPRENLAPAGPLTERSDEELLACFRGGRQEAFAVLVRRYERELYGYLRRYLGDASLADDVFQNTFLQLYTKAATYQAGRPVRPWLYTIATHQAIDAMRRAGRRSTLSLEQRRQAGSDSAGRNLSSLLESPLPGPATLVELDEQRRRVRESVDGLPEFLRHVVILTYFQGLKYREVADILGIPVGTVKSRLHAAIVRLQEHWSATPPQTP